MSSASRRPAPMRPAPTGGRTGDELTLRDWFAGAALKGILADGRVLGPKDTATLAYDYADAVMAARERWRTEQ